MNIFDFTFRIIICAMLAMGVLSFIDILQLNTNNLLLQIIILLPIIFAFLYGIILIIFFKADMLIDKKRKRIRCEGIKND